MCIALLLAGDDVTDREVISLEATPEDADSPGTDTSDGAFEGIEPNPDNALGASNENATIPVPDAGNEATNAAASPTPNAVGNAVNNAASSPTPDAANGANNALASPAPNAVLVTATSPAPNAVSNAASSPEPVVEGNAVGNTVPSPAPDAGVNSIGINSGTHTADLHA